MVSGVRSQFLQLGPTFSKRHRRAVGLLGWVPLSTDLTGKLHPCLPSCHLGRQGAEQKCGKDCQIFPPSDDSTDRDISGRTGVGSGVPA